ncbi:MAG: HAMP domain-containing histidine kinase [Alphaproteobacteria bacterium]|nr:HAMP domain-containing histidine kinase [Alphaproteobacteria bacterium]MDE2162535.1 HAMP domain-containing histidine kinase [Alphaproteobacteria bacterium]MDE2265887.1 HAMP domain-containing histidine kinase [Alphaproteobacteria bacterium]MDE2499273.1 HAMP domain-containing histidine kinase [Alphaproteobacteria bacterium]
MRLGQLLKSASFKLTAAYVGLFSVSVGILAGLVYFSSTSQLQQTIRTRIVADSNALRAEYVHGGTDQLLQAISERQRGRLIGGLDYTLYDAKGKHLFGTLPAVPCKRGWVTFTGPPDGDEPSGEMEKLGVLVTPLTGGYCLLVGDDIGKIGKFGSLILDSFGWVFLLTVTMAVAGGFFLSSRVLRRIEAISRTAEAIIEGDISRRIPRREAPDDLDRLAATLNRMLDRTTTLMESLRHVSNDVAHDLRTPLGRLRHSLEEARRNALSPEEYRTAIDKAVSEVDSILDTFGAILRIAQIESGSRRTGFQDLLLSDLAMDVCETFAPSMEDAGKKLHTEVQHDLWIHGDRELLVQALANLLENAIAHTPADAAVTVALKRGRDGVNLSVADNGCGVPEAERERIFKRFYRLERSRTMAGNGLGLSIVAAVAELHGAKISASDNQPGLKINIAFPAIA